MTPTMFPGAIDVTSSSSADPKAPYGGKPWVGGSGKAKLIIHTIEGADPWTVGWPRNWAGWTSTPHLAMNSDRYPNGDWLYQTLPFNKAGYALRLNAGEDDKFVYQIEVAGKAANVSSYPDSFYQALGEVCQWFVDNMNVASEFMDFGCCSYGAYTDCRVTQAEMDKFSGIAGHCHFGRGTDTHGDPGNLDIDRLRSFMNTEDTMARWLYPSQAEPPTTTDQRFVLESYQIAAVEQFLDKRYDPLTGTRTFLLGAGVTVGVWDEAFKSVLVHVLPWTDGTAIGPREAAALRPSTMERHIHTFTGETGVNV